MEPTRIELLGDDGEWQELRGVMNVVLYDEPETARAAAEQIREVQAAVTAFMRAYAEAVRPVIEEVGRAFQALRAAALVDDDGKPSKRTDRPAWQSPYGPPARRR